MSNYGVASKPLLQCLRQSYAKSVSIASLQSARSFQTTAVPHEEAQTDSTTAADKALDPALVNGSPRLEKKSGRSGVPLVGSRRRRAALNGSENLPFELLPYQCFQEARKVLQADREEKLKAISREQARIERLQALTDEQAGSANVKRSKLGSMEKHLNNLKVWADINDPLIKRKFEDGEGDMNLPIYRHLANEKWREYQYRILVQRITQMKVIPDVLPHCDPVVDVKLYFNRKIVQPGAFVDSKVSMSTPKLNVQSFEAGEKLVTIAVVNPDIPNLETNGFDYQCHYLAVNIPISPTNTHIDLANLAEGAEVLLPWLPPAAQKGSPYHRLPLFIMEQKDNKPLDAEAIKAKGLVRHDLRLRTLQTRHKLTPIGAHLFRTQWDENTDEVMQELGMDAVGFELRRKRGEKLPYKRRNPASFR
ncbi:54S ribosomal protein L35, mitochondrial [Talaromyces islandicus]|uniref:Large ribosomal subunit protein mL38 n=1 Tax=Talaromyces islandicus TaxID=28573 RepID=A0A0U1LMV6_TALIS|nr:54S ribosomal protein L35, mitochondrial [Talaromyces islandicus]